MEKKQLPKDANTGLIRRYDAIAGHWEGNMYESLRRDDLLPVLITHAALENRQRILDAMCGTGILSVAIQKEVPHVQIDALDFSEEMLRRVPPGIRTIRASVTDTGLKQESYDRIFIRSALYDLPAKLQIETLSHVRELLTSEGKFLLQTYCTTLDTRSAMNDIINLKDILAGNGPPSPEQARYFATSDELKGWMDATGWKEQTIRTFVSTIQMMKVPEMSDEGRTHWATHMHQLSEDVRQSIGLREHPDGTITYELPGRIYLCEKQ